MSSSHRRHERLYLNTEPRSMVERCLLACKSRKVFLALAILGFCALIFGAFWLAGMDLFDWFRNF